MGNRGSLQQAAVHTGLSAWELRTGALSGKYPAMRIGGPRGKFWFDFELLDKAIEAHMVVNTMPSESESKIRAIR